MSDDSVSVLTTTEPNQSLECPTDDCDSEQFTVSILARMGPQDSIGVRCPECERPVIDADINTANPGVREQIVDIFGG